MLHIILPLDITIEDVYYDIISWTESLTCIVIMLTVEVLLQRYTKIKLFYVGIDFLKIKNVILYYIF